MKSDPVLTPDDFMNAIRKVRADWFRLGLNSRHVRVGFAREVAAEVERLTRERVEKRERELVCTLCGSTGCKEDGKPQITRAEFKRREEER